MLPSIRLLLETWLVVIDLGAWELQDDGVWFRHWERVPGHVRELGVY